MAKGLLQLAGVVSGAGKSLQSGLGEIAKYEMARSIEDTRRQYDDLRQQRLLEAQRGMHTESLAATARQGEETRTLQREQHQERLGFDILQQTKKDELARDLAAKEDTRVREIEAQREGSAERIHAADRGSQEKIAELNRKSTEAIHEADRALKKYEIETSAESLTKTAASKAIAEVGNEITRLNTLMANPMLDPNGAQAKNLVDRLKRLEQLHDAYSSYLSPKGMESASRPAEKELPSFNLGKYAPKKATPAPAAVEPKGLLNSPGVRVLPVPSEDVQRQYAPSTLSEDELMRRSIEQ